MGWWPTRKLVKALSPKLDFSMLDFDLVLGLDFDLGLGLGICRPLSNVVSVTLISLVMNHDAGCKFNSL